VFCGLFFAVYFYFETYKKGEGRAKKQGKFSVSRNYAT
jgi:hypothetical protein